MTDASRQHHCPSLVPVDAGRLAVIERAATTLLPPRVTSSLLVQSLAEDEFDVGDVSTQSMIGASDVATAALVVRQPGVIAGLQPISLGLAETPYGDEITLEPVATDGDEVDAGRVIAMLSGPCRDLLGLERSLLNLLCLSCGVATHTAAFVAAVAHTNVVICATRKTIPGLRAWQKYAVICGGGDPHRMSLADAAMFKDNHLAGITNVDLTSRVTEGVGKARAARALKFVSVEVDTIEQFEALLAVEDGLVDIALLDNMSADVLAKCVVLRDQSNSHLLLEATGNVTLKTVGRLAESGVDRISTGAITHSAPWLDIGLDMQTDSSANKGTS